jgi:gliding motility-associated-like protein
MIMKKFSVALLLGFSSMSQIFAQSPNWTVDATQYENSMNIVAVMVIKGIESTSDNSKIGAFVGGQVRGVATTSVLTSGGSKVAYLQIYSNVGDGEIITFQLFDAVSNTIVASVNEVTFQKDNVLGTSASPYIIGDNNVPTDITLSIESLSESTETETVVGVFTTTDLDVDDTFSYTLVEGEGDDDNSSFTIVNGELILIEELDFESQPTLSIRVQTTDSQNGIFVKIIYLSVVDGIDEGQPLPVNNFISANGDGYNDFFFVENVGLYVDYTLVIFNNNGVAVYSKKGYTNDWSGTSSSGIQLTNGTYYYSLTKSNRKAGFRGSFTLVR